MIPQVQIRLGQTFPVALVLRLDGTLVFVKLTAESFTVIGDDSVFDHNGFTIKGEDFSYYTPYFFREQPLIHQWIRQQNIPNPFTTETA